MDAKITIEKEYPPRIHTAIVKGFNTLANNAYLLILPILLDVFLWLGPKLSAKNTLASIIDQYGAYVQLQTAQPGFSAEQMSQMQSIQFLNIDLQNTFNLFGFMNTLPIGVPSLFGLLNTIQMGMTTLFDFRTILDNPFGSVQIIPTASISQEFLYFVGLIIIGSFFGGIYLSEIGRRSNLMNENNNFLFKKLATDVGWMMIINFVIWLSIMLIIIPFTLIFFTLIFQYVGYEIVLNFLILIYFLILFWTIIPMVYIPHGVILQKQDPLNALLCSRRLVRYYMPGTGFFIMVSILAYLLLNRLLWLMPKSSSFMLLGGIFGHAFICTGLIASSFFYFQDGVKWMKHNLKMIAQQSNQTSRPFQA